MSDKYRESGVDLEAGYQSVRLIKEHVMRTQINGSIHSLGAFGGMFDCSVLQWKEPVLVSGTDGVGTKLMLAFEEDKHDTIGIDVVAMCVNDVLVQGALPIFFLDYIAIGKNEPHKIAQIVKGIADGCIMSGCALIGGETAEMPDMYHQNHYDLAGFCVGVVEKHKLLDGSAIAPGHTIIGLPSSGCHSNGFSLIRKVLFKDGNLDLKAVYDGFEKPLAEVLLTPTKIYVKAIKQLLHHHVDVKGMAHITGGGFYENIPRMLKEGLGVCIDTTSFPTPEIFQLIMRIGGIPEREMYNVFNMGIGFVIVVEDKDVKKVQSLLQQVHEQSFVIGKVTESGGVDLTW